LAFELTSTATVAMSTIPKRKTALEAMLKRLPVDPPCVLQHKVVARAEEAVQRALERNVRSGVLKKA
jgi:hypothetical protein